MLPSLFTRIVESSDTTRSELSSGECDGSPLAESERENNAPAIAGTHGGENFTGR